MALVGNLIRRVSVRGSKYLHYPGSGCIRIMQFFILTLFLYGCFTPIKDRYEEILNSWLDRDEYELVMYWGQPDVVYTLANGKRILEYERQNMGFHQDSNNNLIPFKYFCVTSFTVDRSGKIIKNGYEGNDCWTD